MYSEPKKMTNKKKIELLILVIIALWLVLFAINYVRFADSKAPIFAMHLTHKYDDGVTEEYVSLGYVYRQYRRNSVNREELVPFWVPMENPKAEPDLPTALTGYTVPENYRRYDNFRGLVYWFSVKGELQGTYKCLNSNGNCKKAFSGSDVYNLIDKDPTTYGVEPRVLGPVHDKFGFVDDSAPQDISYGEPAYDRIIYLYKFLDPELDENKEKVKIIAKFADVKESTVDENKNIGYGDENRYIVKSMDNQKWGIIKIKKSGEIEEVLPYEYDSITYDKDTKYYIMCKNKKWYVYDLNNKKTVSIESEYPIYDVWTNANRTQYIKVGIDRTVGTDEFTDFKVYRIDGKSFLDGDKITAVFPRGKFLFYITARDNHLRFIDYSGEELYKYKLNFWRLKHDKLTQPAFMIYNETEKFITLRVYDTRELSYNYEIKVINVVNWKANE